MADLVAVVFLLYGVLMGLWRGIYKELVALLAIGAGAFVALGVRGAVAGVGGALGFGPLFEACTCAAVFLVIFLPVALIGRRVVKRLKGASHEKDGDGPPGPVTAVFSPVVGSVSGFVYWTDKGLGAALGLVKATVALGLVFFVAMQVALLSRNDTALSRSIPDSFAAAAFARLVDPWLVAWEPYRLLKNVSRIERLAEACADDAAKLDRAARHPALAPLRDHPKLAALSSDTEVSSAWRRHDLRALVSNPKVREVLSDPSFRSAVASTDWDSVLRDVGVNPKR